LTCWFNQDQIRSWTSGGQHGPSSLCGLNTCLTSISKHDSLRLNYLLFNNIIMTPFNLSEMLDDRTRLFIHLMFTANDVRSKITTVLGPFGLTLSQFGVLDTIYHLGPRRQKDLGATIFKTEGNITKVVDNLEKKRLVQRIQDKNDRRSYQINLTPEGRKLVSQAVPEVTGAVETQMSRLNARERKTMIELCLKLGAA